MQLGLAWPSAGCAGHLALLPPQVKRRGSAQPSAGSAAAAGAPGLLARSPLLLQQPADSCPARALRRRPPAGGHAAQRLHMPASSAGSAVARCGARPRLPCAWPCAVRTIAASVPTLCAGSVPRARLPPSPVLTRRRVLSERMRSKAEQLRDLTRVARPRSYG